MKVNDDYRVNPDFWENMRKYQDGLEKMGEEVNTAKNTNAADFEIRLATEELKDYNEISEQPSFIPIPHGSQPDYPFSMRPSCPKCAWTKCRVTYCTKRGKCLLSDADHLNVKCLHCKFKFAMATKQFDQNESLPDSVLLGAELTPGEPSATASNDEHYLPDSNGVDTSVFKSYFDYWIEKKVAEGDLLWKEWSGGGIPTVSVVPVPVGHASFPTDHLPDETLTPAEPTSTNNAETTKEQN